MKKTLATLLVLAMVMSVCCAMFVSASDPLADLKAELEALVGSAEDAAYSWNIDVAVDGNKVTAVLTVNDLDGKGVNYIEGYFYYDAEQLTVKNAVNKDGSLDCVTAPTGDQWENLSILNQDDDGNLIPGEIVLNVLNAEDEEVLSSENPIVFTLEFELVEGGNLAGMYVASESTVAYDSEYNALAGNGAYGIVYIPSEEPDVPVENTKAVINVNENAILTDGKTGFTGGWSEVGTANVVLVNNGNCQNAGMDVTLNYALGETKKIDGITLDLYHCADVMIGYPEGQATVLVSVDGETYTEVGKYDLAAAEVALGKPGTVSTAITFDAVDAAYVQILLYAGSSTGVLGDTPADNKIFWEFISVAEVAVSEAPAAPVENTKVEINVNENAILTDGKTGFTGGWSEVGTANVVLANNGNCQNAGMDVTLNYALGETKKIDGITLDLYHCADVMIGYPEGQATVLVSVDGETYTEVGKYDLAAAEVALGKPGTVSTAITFDAVDAAYVQILLYAGSSTGVLGDTPADNKIFWEFISVAEVAVSEAPVEPDEPTEEKHVINISHVNCYTWGVYNAMIITGEGQNSLSKLTYNCEWWIALKVDNVDGVYTVTAIEGAGVAKEMTASADGFIVYIYSNDVDSWNAAAAVEVGDVMLECTVDWSTDVASETPVGTLTFGPAPVVEEPDSSEPEVSEPEVSEPEVSEPSDSTPDAGDAGILIFAILGVLAIAGAAVVIKVRN